ncbi:MAG: SDR family oxidoreductase [Pyrinomonadaceae bacterium]|nr:SDR family oxidoreductase [Phycisphaerales bacterium]
MRQSRRTFLATTAATGALAAIAQRSSASGLAGISKGRKKMKILILGGTKFLGPQIVEAAQARGHTLTLFNRGKTHPGLFPEIEKLRGDRETADLKSLESRQWDAVVDTSAYIPRHVNEVLAILAGSVKQYVFISSISVYADKSTPNQDESAPVGVLEDPTVEKVGGASYGPLKALCEQAAEKAMPGKVTNIRPGLIVGPGDQTDRFTYWPSRVSLGGEVLAPGTADDPIQVIDVRDLGEWIVKTIEDSTVGVYNAMGPTGGLSIGKLLEACKAVTKSDARFTWADAAFLASMNVAGWSDMPVWLPPGGDSAGFCRFKFDRAVKAGLKFRSLDASVKDTLEWHQSRPEAERKELKAGIKPEREADVLKAWHGKKTR